MKMKPDLMSKYDYYFFPHFNFPILYKQRGDLAGKQKWSASTGHFLSKKTSKVISRPIADKILMPLDAYNFG